MKTCKICKKDHVMIVMETSGFIANSQEIRYCLLCGALYVGVRPSALGSLEDTEMFMEDGLCYVTYYNSAGAKIFGDKK